MREGEEKDGKQNKSGPVGRTPAKKTPTFQKSRLHIRKTRRRKIRNTGARPNCRSLSTPHSRSVTGILRRKVQGGAGRKMEPPREHGVRIYRKCGIRKGKGVPLCGWTLTRRDVYWEVRKGTKLGETRNKERNEPQLDRETVDPFSYNKPRRTIVLGAKVFAQTKKKEDRRGSAGDPVTTHG